MLERLKKTAVTPLDAKFCAHLNRREARLKNHWLGYPCDHVHFLWLGAFHQTQSENTANLESTKKEDAISNKVAPLLVMYLQLCALQCLPHKCAATKL